MAEGNNKDDLDAAPIQFNFDEDRTCDVTTSPQNNNKSSDVTERKTAFFNFDQGKYDDDDVTSDFRAHDDDGWAPAETPAFDIGPCDVKLPGVAMTSSAIAIVTERVNRERGRSGSVDYSKLSPHQNVNRLRHPTDPSTVHKTTRCTFSTAKQHYTCSVIATYLLFRSTQLRQVRL